MDDGDLDFSNPATYLCPATGNADLPVESCSMGSYFDDIFQDDEHLACTHTHTCNPPVDDHSHTHTHTCIHVHTKIVPASSDESGGGPSKKRPAGNRAAVRRYREKKKAHTALLEEEAAHLKALNKQLLKKLQNHAALKAEAARLRFLLVDFRGRIEGEIGAFPYRRPLKSNDLVPGVDPHEMSSCGFRCNDVDDQMYRNPGMQQQRSMGDGGGVMSGQVLGQGAAGDIANIRCTGSAKPPVVMPPGCGGLGTMPSGRLPNAEK